MADMNKLGMAALMANDPTPTDVWDYYQSRSNMNPQSRSPLMQDMNGMYPMSERPGMDLAVNGTQAALYALIARMMSDAPGPLKAAMLPAGYMALDSGGQAIRNYQQLQGTHPMQKRQSAWEHLMDAAARSTPQTGFDRSRFTKD